MFTEFSEKQQIELNELSKKKRFLELKNSFKKIKNNLFDSINSTLEVGLYIIAVYALIHFVIKFW